MNNESGLRIVVRCPVDGCGQRLAINVEKARTQANICGKCKNKFKLEDNELDQLIAAQGRGTDDNALQDKSAEVPAEDLPPATGLPRWAPLPSKPSRARKGLSWAAVLVLGGLSVVFLTHILTTGPATSKSIEPQKTEDVVETSVKAVNNNEQSITDVAKEVSPAEAAELEEQRQQRNNRAYWGAFMIKGLLVFLALAVLWQIFRTVWEKG